MKTMAAILFLWIAFSKSILAADIGGRRGSSFDNLSTQRYEIWAALAIDYVRNTSCDHLFFAVPSQCKRMKQTSNERMNVFSAEANKHRKLAAVAPDGTLTKSGTHDGIVVIDPFPAASFGHFVMVFFVDRFDRALCALSGGIYIENHNDCLRLASKDACHNLPEVEHRFQNDVQRHAARRLHRCQIDFLPFVYEVSNNAVVDAVPPRKTPMDEQKLQCREANGFARCPFGHRSINAANRGTTRQSISSSSEIESTPDFRCQLFEMCDHAVVVHGGWGRLTSRRGDFELLKSTKRMLTETGFPDANVKLFYKNGIADEEIENGVQNRQSRRGGVNNETTSKFYPASNKRFMRSYIKSACSRLRCVDTLVVFLKGPALHDGSLLLHDADDNGLASQDEIYTNKEILTDLVNCTARRVYLVADYSYSGRLTNLLKQKRRSDSNDVYDNLIAVTSGDDEQYSWDNQFTKSWTTSNHRSTCFKKVFRTNKDLVSHSNPTIFDDGSRDDDDDSGTTLFGAPCNLYPPLSDDELKEKYFGCNNIPSWLWFQTTISNSTSSPPIQSSSRYHQSRVRR